MDHVRLGLFKILKKVLLVTYKLDLLEQIRIYPIQHIVMLELAYGDATLLVYKADTYRG